MKILTPVIPDQPHPTSRDHDGGAVMVNGNEPRARGRINHERLTPAERIHFGFATAEDLKWQSDQNRKHETWLASESGREWLCKAGLKSNTVATQPDGTKAGAM